ncbi:MAG TPA: hypothetical protein VM677_23365 [Actinokineospora sp.]|jgi:hypothetical protein|nr:hypothetical protein [Actinokineospora sp.]
MTARNRVPVNDVSLDWFADIKNPPHAGVSLDHDGVSGALQPPKCEFPDFFENAAEERGKTG